MEFRECLKTRRSVRRYTDEKVSREQLSELVALAQFAPTWKNSQTVRYVIVDDPERKAEIGEQVVMGFSGNGERIRCCAALVALVTVEGISGYDPDGTPTTVKGSHWESFDAGIACQSFCLAAHDAGLGTVIMGIYDPEKAAQLLQLSEGESVACLIALGYPGEGSHGKTTRKPLEEVLRFL